jgi:hypothetical protein
MPENRNTKTIFLLKTMEELLRDAQDHVNAEGEVDVEFLPEPYRSEIRPFNDTRDPQPYTGRNFISELLKVVNGNKRHFKR